MLSQCITNEKAAKIIQGITGSQVFSVEFIKRTTGEVRKMNCRKGVTKGLTGDGPAYDARSKNLVTVYDMGANGFRMINLERVISIKAGGKLYMVNDFPTKCFRFRWTTGLDGVDHEKHISARTIESAKITFKRECGLKRMPHGCIVTEIG